MRTAMSAIVEPVLPLPLERRFVNNWWCTHHWEPYQVNAKAGESACSRLSAHVLTRKDFQKAVAQVQRKYKFTLERARVVVITDWVKRNQRPVCCLLGDATMNRIQKQGQA